MRWLLFVVLLAPTCCYAADLVSALAKHREGQKAQKAQPQVAQYEWRLMWSSRYRQYMWFRVQKQAANQQCHT